MDWLRLAGIFLPGLVDVDKCRGKDGTLNPPICIAWSSKGHNHYIATIPVKGLNCLDF